jgi:hypothetical protein
MEEDAGSGGWQQRSSPPHAFVGQKRWCTPLPPNPTPMTFRHTTASNPRHSIASSSYFRVLEGSEQASTSLQAALHHSPIPSTPTVANSPRNPLYAKRAEQKKLVSEPPAPTSPAQDPESQDSADVEEMVAGIQKLSEAMAHQEEALGSNEMARELAGLLQVCPNIHSIRGI